MGKSPGKWIKTVLFGKKSSKSNFSKKAETRKDAVMIAKAPPSDFAANSPSISDSAPHITDKSEENFGLGKEITANLPHDVGVLLPQHQAADTKGNIESCSPNNIKVPWQEQAATKVQAAVRGYMARRAFWALKGIIRLQALIRGHLVRRQAVATLLCVQGVVKLQACVRGRRVRVSDAGLEVDQKCMPLEAKPVAKIVVVSTRPKKLSENAFVCKLLASLPTAMPLSLQYDPLEPNSAWSWLERWSSSRFWRPFKQPNILVDSKSQTKQANDQIVGTETLKPKRGGRKVPTINADSDPSLPISEHEKSKTSLKKSLGHQAAPGQENPKVELEKPKRHLRKVSASTTKGDDKSETATEKHKLKKLSSSCPVPDASEQVGIPPTSSVMEELVDVLSNEHLIVEPSPTENIGNDENTLLIKEKLESKEDEISKENQKSRRRRSLPSKQEYPENGSQNSPKLPSYMAATESAKAKLRAQGSPRFVQDEAENGFTRRHSLPSSTNIKMSSLSPRLQRLAQATGKGGIRTEKSLLSSRDSQEKVTHAEWRR